LSSKSVNANQLIFHNDYGIKIRTEKILAEVLGISRSKAQKIVDKNNCPKYISKTTVLSGGLS